MYKKIRNKIKRLNINLISMFVLEMKIPLAFNMDVDALFFRSLKKFNPERNFELRSVQSEW